jgi:hypothetical protein
LSLPLLYTLSSPSLVNFISHSLITNTSQLCTSNPHSSPPPWLPALPQTSSSSLHSPPPPTSPSSFKYALTSPEHCLPHTPSNTRQLDSYISSLADYVTKAIATADPSLIAQKAKIQKELASFAATATYSIPSDVTALANIATFTTVPAWYSALPSDVKSYYDKENAIVESILYQAVGVNQTSASGKATASGTGTAASQTGAATKVGVLGAGMAAAFLGVVAL